MRKVVSFFTAGFCLCALSQAQTKPNLTEKPFAFGGKVEMQLDGGSYEIRPSADTHIRVTLRGNIGNAKVTLNSTGTRATLAVSDTPHRDFHATIELPSSTDVTVRLTGGELMMTGIRGSKDIDSKAGDVQIGVGDPNDYASVDASVKVGDLNANVFGGSKSGLLQHFTWSGKGKYALKASLGAGDLVLREK